MPSIQTEEGCHALRIFLSVEVSLSEILLQYIWLGSLPLEMYDRLIITIACTNTSATPSSVTVLGQLQI